MNYRNGTNLIATATTDADSPVIARITAQDCSPIVGKTDGTTASGVLFGITVPEAGLYPFRLVWENGGGDATCEWFVRDPVLGEYLINASSSPVKAWITRDVNYAGALPAPMLNDPTVSGENVIISWTGEGEVWELTRSTGPGSSQPTRPIRQPSPRIRSCRRVTSASAGMDNHIRLGDNIIAAG